MGGESIPSEIKTKIIVFEDGTYFNGVKGKSIRKTNNFADAKRVDGELSDRDLRYLKEKKYKMLNVVMKIEICDA